MVRLLGVVLATSLFGLAACADDPAVDARPSTSTGSNQAPGSTWDCAALIPDSALTSLGWSSGGAAEEHAGRCERRVTGSGVVTVTTRAVTTAGPDAAREELEAQCGELRSGGEYVDQPVAWLVPEREPSCATALAQTRTGVAELYFVNDVDEVVQVRVEALTPVESDQLQAGMAELVGGAASLSD